MRLYTFVNAHYMREIQWGIQTAHIVGEFVAERPLLTPKETERLDRWAAEFKTIVVLNGGNVASLLSVADYIEIRAEEAGLPVTCFYEDEASLNNAITAVGIIATEEMCTYMDAMRADDTFVIAELKLALPDVVIELCEFIAGHRLAQ